MSYELMVILGYSILPAAIVGLVRYRFVDTLNRPIMLCIMLGLVNEIISTVVIAKGYSNAINSNLYSLAEALLILVQFRRWGLFEQQRNLFYSLLFLVLAGWALQYRSMERLGLFLPFFRSISSAGIVIMAIIEMNKLIISYPGTILKSPGFLFCAGFCLFFTMSMLVEMLLYFNWVRSIDFKDTLFKSAIIVNVISNFLYLIAILWMPQKLRYIMQ